MRQIPKFVLGLLFLTACLTFPNQYLTAQPSLDPQQILKQLVSEVPDIKMVTANDMEPNPQGKFRRYAYIQGDFNQDGKEDVAICATEGWVRGRNAYVVIASKKKDGTWVRVFFQKFDGTAYPFLIWDKERKALVVGANFSDSNPGDIIWDRTTNKYKLIEAVEN